MNIKTKNLEIYIISRLQNNIRFFLCILGRKVGLYETSVLRMPSLTVAMISETSEDSSGGEHGNIRIKAQQSNV